MSQTKTSKERKTKAPTAVNNGVAFHKNATVQKVVKEAKQDVKTEHGKPSDKNQPTAEQMRIAQIIDTKSEDPSLKEKLMQVMDATKTSVDDAFTALHDSDNDPNRAVNLLLERGNRQDEWSTSSKKKKTRSPNEKKESPNADIPAPPEPEDWTNRVNKSSEVSRGVNRNRDRDRSFQKMARGKSLGPNENEKVKRGRGELNGPSRGGKSFRGRPSARGFGRGGRSGGGGFRRVDTWNQDSESQPINNVYNQSVDDWDSEEYTGSLANSQVFTPSAPPEPTVLHGSSANSSFQSIPDPEEPKERLPDRTQIPTSECGTTSISPPQILSHFSLQQQRALQASPPSMNKNNIGIADSMLLENKGVAHSHSGETNNSISQVSALCMSKNDYIYSSVGRGRSLGLMNYTQPTEDVRIQRINPSKPKPRERPPSKIPSSAVEMPPDADSAIGLLDVQFGALEFGENSTEPVHATPPSSRPSTPSPQPSEAIVTPGIPASESILSNDSRSFSPSPGTGTNSLTSQITTEPTKIPESTSSSLYQDNVYHSSSLYTKPAQHSQSIYNQEYNTSHTQRQPGQITSNNIIYSTSSNTLSTYASSSAGSYGNSSYPNYQYPNYPIISQPTTIPTSSSNNSYQVTVSAQQYSNNSQSVYGSSGLGASSYNSAYQGYNQLNHKSLASSTPSNKEFDSSTPSVNLNSITHSSSISAANSLLSSSQSTPVSKPSSGSSMAKGAVVASMPPGVPGLVGTHQYIMGQGGVPYFQQPPVYYEDLQIMPQQRLPHHITTGYYEMGYQPTTTREGVQYNMSDGRFARADNTSPVQVSSMNQQSGTQAHQQPLMNPTAMPPAAYAYFYGGSMIPGNFQFSAPTIYPVAATSTTGHGSSSSGIYGKPSSYTGNYSGIYDSNQSNVNEYKSSSTPGPKSQSTAVVNPSTSSDIPIMYSKSHSALSKSYDKGGFHCPTPPPFNLGSQNSGLAPAGSYPQHLFIPTITPHHNTTLMHQPIHQESTNTVNSRSAINNNPNKNSGKSNYSTSNYWTPN
uniref:Protein lingerer n=1 Tax=Lygus hesperus TaxID=30085 RepID=A0A0A9XHF5_LYGHE